MIIIDSMTYKEIHNEILEDSYKIRIKQECLKTKVIRKFKKEKNFPAYEIINYKIPATNNEYIIFFYAKNYNCIKSLYTDSFCIAFDKTARHRVIIRCLYGGYRPKNNTSIQKILQLHIYTSHFLQRYNERFLKNPILSSNEIMCRFIIRNSIITPIPITENINKNIEKYNDKNMQGLVINDGFCFALCGSQTNNSVDMNKQGNIEALLFLYTTFINSLNLSSSQRQTIDKGFYETWKLFINN
ncbi:MAG: hypothetical protein IJ213_00445 [Bacteroidales bacterium]|nr:hypothetical protein [Bacteroidales bacterium]